MKENTTYTEIRTTMKNKKYYKKHVNQISAYMCPICYHISRFKVNNTIDIEYDKKLDIFQETITLLNCPKCGNRVKGIELDHDIASTISLLNQKGYKTKYCCQGHREYLAYIYFEDHVLSFNMINLDSLPESWYVDEDDLAKGKLVIRARDINLNKRIKDIKKWSISLPSYLAEKELLSNTIFI